MDAAFSSFSDIIRKWPGGSAGFAESAGVPVTLVYSWTRHKHIPPEYWSKLITNSRSIGFHAVTLEVLADLAAQK